MPTQSTAIYCNPLQTFCTTAANAEAACGSPSRDSKWRIALQSIPLLQPSEEPSTDDGQWTMDNRQQTTDNRRWMIDGYDMTDE